MNSDFPDWVSTSVPRQLSSDELSQLGFVSTKKPTASGNELTFFPPQWRIEQLDHRSALELGCHRREAKKRTFGYIWGPSK